MINVGEVMQIFSTNQLSTFYGVPDSLLSWLSAFLVDKANAVANTSPNFCHQITANEGNAIGMAMGYYLANNNQKFACVYLQNSGLGNIVNPIVSMASADVMQIPMLLLIGWRGCPLIEKIDEPQHKMQGKITLNLLQLLNIEYEIISPKITISEFEKIVIKMKNLMQQQQKICALVFIENSVSEYKSEIILKHKNSTLQNENYLNREAVLNYLLNYLEKSEKQKACIISTTGKTSRELFEIQNKNLNSRGKNVEVKENENVMNFLMSVGGMGHSSSIALSLALENKKQKIIALDGDGAMLMHLGSLAIIAEVNNNPSNLLHILLNNESHESVGGQATASNNINFELLTKSLCYKNYFLATNFDDIKIALDNFENNYQHNLGTTFLEIKIKIDSRKNLGRPNISPKQNKQQFMQFIQQNKI